MPPVEIGAGLDARLGLSLAELSDVARDSRDLGYASVWTPNADHDPFLLCAEWWHAAQLATGISVLPFSAVGPPPTLAKPALTLAELTGGRFSLGVGTGAWQEVAPTRERLLELRALLAGRVPVLLGALGPRMLRLAGELADGAALNYCTTEHVAWSRGRIAEGARRAGRDPSSVRVVSYVRVAVHEDEDRARRAFAKALLPYALARPGVPKRLGYRAHFARMGFDGALTELESRRDRGAGPDELAGAFPPELMRRVGYFGPAAGAREAFRRLAAGLDVAIVRVVAAEPGVASVRATLEACRP